MKTKKFFIPLVAIIAILVVVLVACGAQSSTPAAQTGSSGTPAANGTPGGRNLTQPLPPAEQLLIGTFKLEGTPNAVTASQAAALVPLWQAYAQLTSSNTAAQAEVDAVITQIQQTLTPQQNQAITDMKLTRQDLATTMTTLGLANGFGGNGTPGTPRAGGNGGGGGGFFPGGGGGGFTGGAGGTGGTRPTPNATQAALRAQYANRIPTPLMNALITLLQKKIGS